jgi:hypothetical protein
MSRIRKSNEPRVGYVTKVSVYPEVREVRVNIVVGQDRELKDIQLYNPHRSFFRVPQKGDYIYVDYIEGKYIAKSVSTQPSHFVPEVENSDICLTPDQRTWLHFATQWASSSDPDDGGLIKDSVNVNLGASGDFKLAMMDPTPGGVESSEDFNPAENSFVKFTRPDKDGETDIDMDVAVSGNMRIHLPDVVENTNDGKKMGGENIVTENTYIEFNRQDDGTVNLDINVSGDVNVTTKQGDISAHAENGKIDVLADGKLNVTSFDEATVYSVNKTKIESLGTTHIDGDDVIIGEESLAESLSYQSHTHDIEDNDGNVTATTNEPNESGTDTTVQ